MNDELDRILNDLACDIRANYADSKKDDEIDNWEEFRSKEEWLIENAKYEIAQHTEEAERRARINVMQQWEADLAYACVYTYDAPYFANQRAIVQKNLAELSAPQQSTSPDGSAE